LKIYDRKCFSCGYEEVDVIASNVAKLRAPCPQCPGKLEWKPVFRSRVNRTFFDPHMGKSYGSVGEMERDAQSRGFAVLPKSEYESRLGSGDLEQKIMNRKDPKLDEAIEKSFYRIRFGYKDHPDLPKPPESK
jgi:hypothetical protein